MPTHRLPKTSLALGTLLALVLPTALAYNLPPSATVLNQAAAWLGWGVVLLLLAPASAPAWTRAPQALRVLTLALACVVAATAASTARHGLPLGLALSIAATTAAAGVVAWIFACVASNGFDAPDAAGSVAMRALCIGWVAAGLLGTLIGIVQVAWPELPDGTWIARSPFPGRAAGNLRQPNHLAGVLMLSALAAAWWFETAPRSRLAWATAFAALVLGLVLTASRTGAVGVFLMGLWALLDRRLSRSTRTLLIAAAVITPLCWWMLSLATAGGGAERLHASDISSSRFAIWANTFELLRLYPWEGVGIGEFNRAWTLTEFVHRRPVAFFDHTHNVALQLIVEMGLPLGAAVTGMLGYALWRAAVAASLAQRFAFMMVVMTVLHSQLEYPLWYAHFLFPTAAMLGLCLAPAGAGARPGGRAAWRPLAATLAAGLALSLGSVWMVADYARVVAIYAPGPGAPSLDERIADGRASLFFPHHGDYALVTTGESPSPDDFARATHYLLDARLMMAWARSFAAHGDEDRGRWIAARLREFHNDNAKDFFAECEDVQDPRPFQCEAPQRRYGPDDFR